MQGFKDDVELLAKHDPEYLAPKPPNVESEYQVIMDLLRSCRYRKHQLCDPEGNLVDISVVQSRNRIIAQIESFHSILVSSFILSRRATGPEIRSHVQHQFNNPRQTPPMFESLNRAQELQQ